MTAVVLRDATLQFERGRGVVNLDGTLEAGSVVAVVGASGSGKSTLLRLMAGVAVPDRGEVVALGRNPSALSRSELARHRAEVGLLHQSDNLTFGLRVVHNVLMGNLGRWSSLRALTSLVRPARGDVEAASAALARVELDDRLWSWPAELSGGEQQRVAFARLIVQRPRLWIADEPTAGLDARLRRDVLRIMMDVARDQGATVVVALHDLELLDVGFDEVWGLRHGALALRSPAADLSSAELRSLYAKDDA